MHVSNKFDMEHPGLLIIWPTECVFINGMQANVLGKFVQCSLTSYGKI